MIHINQKIDLFIIAVTYLLETETVNKKMIMKTILKECILVCFFTMSYSLKTNGYSSLFTDYPLDQSKTILPNVQNIAKECFLKSTCFSGFTINPIGVASLHNTQVIFLNHNDLDDGGHMIRYEIAKLLNEPSLILITNDDIYYNDSDYARQIWGFYVNSYKEYYSNEIDYINYRIDVLIHFHEKQKYDLNKDGLNFFHGVILIIAFIFYL